MIVLILIVAFIVLIDASGYNLDDKVISLIYMTDEDPVESEELDFDTKDMSADQLAKKAEEHIFEGGSSDGKTKTK